jgi:hypothetical protein
MAADENELADLLARLRALEATLARSPEHPDAARAVGQAVSRLANLARLDELTAHIQAELGVTERQVFEAVDRVLPLAARQAEHVTGIREQLLELLMADLDLLDPVPHASVAQAQRVAELRNRLLSSGGWTIGALAEARSASRSAVRTWLVRQRRAGRLITVSVRGETYIPALLLDEVADPHPGSELVLRPLLAAGLDGWATWAWLDSPSPWLDGRRPGALLAAGDPDAAASAARAQAANAMSEPADADAA